MSYMCMLLTNAFTFLMSHVESLCVICCFAIAQNVKTVQVHFIDKISVKKNH